MRPNQRLDGLAALAPQPRECIIDPSVEGRARVQADGWKNHTSLPHIEGDWKGRDGRGLQG
jgi:hypothetical protein